MNTPRWKVVLAAFGLFVAGLMVGGLVTAKIGAHLIRKAWLAPSTARGPVDRAVERIQKNLTSELKLDATQSAAVQTELALTAQEFKTLRVETIQKARADIADSVRRIAATLPPEKRADFYKLVKERFARFEMPAPGDETP
ncbi:MAG: hypothetical protein WC661_14590 [Opitutaceae bacterium]|jgi:esterase/lipase